MGFVRASREAVLSLKLEALYLEADVILLYCGWTLGLPPLGFCILNQNDEITLKSTQKIFRWGTCYVASKW